MYKDYDNYRTYENDDLSAGATLKVEHTIIVNENDILNLISQPLEKIKAMRDNNVKKEKADDFLIQNLITLLKKLFVD